MPKITIPYIIFLLIISHTVVYLLGEIRQIGKNVKVLENLKEEIKQIRSE